MRLLIQTSLLAGCLLFFIHLGAQAQEDKGAPFKKAGDAFVKQEKFAKALSEYQKMLKAYQGAKDPEGIAEAHKFIGLAYALQPKYDSSAYYYNKSIELHAKIYGQKSSFVASLQRDLALMLQEQGKYDQAMDMFRKSLAISQYINRKALAAFNYIHIGALLMQQNQIDSASVCFDKALMFRKQIYSANDHRLAEIYNLQGEIYALKKDYDQALKSYEKAIQVNRIEALERLKSLALKAQTLQLNDPAAALKAYQETDAYIGTLRGKMKTQADRVRLGKTADEVNQGGLETSLQIKDYKTAFYWSQLWVKTLHFQCNTLVMRKNRVSSANLSNLPALRHGLAKEDFQSERKTPVLSVQGGLVLRKRRIQCACGLVSQKPDSQPGNHSGFNGTRNCPARVCGYQ